jgi:hypothetical protein
MNTYQIGEKVVVGRFFKELTKAEVLAFTPSNEVVVLLEGKFRDHKVADLVAVPATEILPLDATVCIR